MRVHVLIFDDDILAFQNLCNACNWPGWSFRRVENTPDLKILGQEADLILIGEDFIMKQSPITGAVVRSLMDNGSRIVPWGNGKDPRSFKKTEPTEIIDTLLATLEPDMTDMVKAKYSNAK